MAKIYMKLILGTNQYNGQIWNVVLEYQQQYLSFWNYFINIFIFYRYRWVNVVLDRIIFRVNMFNKSMLQDRETLIERMNAVHKQILVHQQTRRQEIVELEKKFVDETENIVDALFDYLHSSEFEEKLTTWENGEIPTDEDTWTVMKAKIEKALEKNLKRRWQNGKKGMVSTLKYTRNLSNVFNQGFKFNLYHLHGNGSFPKIFY